MHRRARLALIAIASSNCASQTDRDSLGRGQVVVPHAVAATERLVARREQCSVRGHRGSMADLSLHYCAKCLRGTAAFLHKRHRDRDSGRGRGRDSESRNNHSGSSGCNEERRTNSRRGCKRGVLSRGAQKEAAGGRCLVRVKATQHPWSFVSLHAVHADAGCVGPKQPQSLRPSHSDCLPSERTATNADAILRIPSLCALPPPVLRPAASLPAGGSKGKGGRAQRAARRRSDGGRDGGQKKDKTKQTRRTGGRSKTDAQRGGMEADVRASFLAAAWLRFAPLHFFHAAAPAIMCAGAAERQSEERAGARGITDVSAYLSRKRTNSASARLSVARGAHRLSWHCSSLVCPALCAQQPP
jgi:hypothetical protein